MGMARRSMRRTARRTSRRTARRQNAMFAAATASQQNATPTQDPAPTQDAPSGNIDAQAEQLKKLAELKDQGILTQEEFDAKKKEILGL